MDTNEHDKALLDTTLAWAQARLSGGDEPPWVWYRLMQLREAAESLRAGMDAVKLVALDGVEVDRHGNTPVQLPT